MEVKLVVMSYYLSNSSSLLISYNDYNISTIVKADITKVTNKLVKQLTMSKSLESFYM